MAHYYTNDDVVSAPETFVFYYRDQAITFHTDRGMFSYARVDYGSRVLLETIEIDKAKSLLDVGCGYGAMGLSIVATHKNVQADLIDVNLRALECAKQSALENNLNDVAIYESDVYDQVTKTYDLIISNPPIRAGKKVVSKIIRESIDHMNQEGRLVIVIQKKQGAPSAKKLMEETFGNVTVLKRDKGYYILQSKKNVA